MSSWLLGVLFTICGKITVNLGTTIMRLSHVRNNNKPSRFQRTALCQPVWWAGFMICSLGNVGAFFGLGFASQSITAPLGSIELLSNAVFAAMLLHEPFSKQDIFATASIVAGSVLIIIFGSRQCNSYTLSELLMLFVSPQMIVFMSILVMIGIILSMIIMLDEQRPTRKRPLQNQLLAISYPALNGVIGAFAGLFAKALAELVTQSGSSENSFGKPLTYVFIGLNASCSIIQLVLLNKALARYEASFVVPISYGVWVC